MGLQNPSLRKDFTIAVIDGARGIGNGLVFPAGPLRAPLHTQLDHTDALLIMGDDEGARDIVALAEIADYRYCMAAWSPTTARWKP